MQAVMRACRECSVAQGSHPTLIGYVAAAPLRPLLDWHRPLLPQIVSTHQWSVICMNSIILDA